MNLENEWSLAPDLKAENFAETDLPLCRLVGRDEARFPWVILIPRRHGVSETFDLLPGDRQRMWEEIEAVAMALKAETGAKKINTAAFGNMVPLLHIHVIARFEGDPAWPGSAVGFAGRERYEEGVVPSWWDGLLSRLRLKARTSP